VNRNWWAAVLAMDPQELQRLAPGIDSGDLEGRGLEEPLDELPVREAVIHGQDMERGLCGHRHGGNKRADLNSLLCSLLVFLYLTRRMRRRMLQAAAERKSCRGD